MCDNGVILHVHAENKGTMPMQLRLLTKAKVPVDAAPTQKQWCWDVTLSIETLPLFQRDMCMA